MAKYVVFIVFSDRFKKTTKDGDDDNSPKKDPIAHKILRQFVGWISKEIESGRVQGGQTFADASDEANIRVNYHDPEVPPDELKKDDEGIPILPPPKSSVLRGPEHSQTTQLQGSYFVEYPTTEEVIAWAQSCPVAFDGFSLEIRKLEDPKGSIEAAPEDVKEMVGDQIVSKRKELMEKGDLRKDPDGTLWAKIEDEGWTKELIAEAEKRDVEA